MGVVSGIDCDVKGVGNVTINISYKIGRCITVTFKNLLYVLGLPKRSKGRYLLLMSAKLAVSNGFRCSYAKDEDTLEHVNGSIIVLVRSHGLT
jgi:hypothetical protein